MIQSSSLSAEGLASQLSNSNPAPIKLSSHFALNLMPWTFNFTLPLVNSEEAISPDRYVQTMPNGLHLVRLVEVSRGK